MITHWPFCMSSCLNEHAAGACCDFMFTDGGWCVYSKHLSTDSQLLYFLQSLPMIQIIIKKMLKLRQDPQKFFHAAPDFSVVIVTDGEATRFITCTSKPAKIIRLFMWKYMYILYTAVCPQVSAVCCSTSSHDKFMFGLTPVLCHKI